MSNFSVAHVIADALAEHNVQHSVEEVRGWLEENTAPPHLVKVIDQIRSNLEYHLRVCRAKMLTDTEIIDESARRIARMPPLERKAKSSKTRQAHMGKTGISVGKLYLSDDVATALRQMGKAMGVSRSGFVQLWVEEAVRLVLERTSEVENIPVTRRKGGRSPRLSSTIVNRTVRRLTREELNA